MEKKSKKTPVSRRIFIENGIKGGTAVVMGISAEKLLQTREKDTVKMITASGELVEVPKKFIPEKSGKKVSNQELKQWMGKKNDKVR